MFNSRYDADRKPWSRLKNHIRHKQAPPVWSFDFLMQHCWTTLTPSQKNQLSITVTTEMPVENSSFTPSVMQWTRERRFKYGTLEIPRSFVHLRACQWKKHNQTCQLSKTILTRTSVHSWRAVISTAGDPLRIIIKLSLVVEGPEGRSITQHYRW